MKYKKKDYVSFNSPFSVKTGTITDIETDVFVIKADKFPYSIWKVKVDAIISKIDKEE
jgi:hypothetical protein